MAKKGSSKHQQDLYKKYQTEDRHKKNKLRRLAQHVRHHPMDEQAQKVLSSGKVNYTRNNFKGLKKEPGMVRLKDLPKDQRETLSEQLRRIIDNGELEVKLGR